jgi:hypothetical protein
MSVIVWDGKNLAADTLAVNGNLKRRTSKVWRKGDMLIGGAGTASGLAAMVDWVTNQECAPDKFPKLREHEDVCLWVVNKNGNMAKFEDSPHPIVYHDKTWADGSGRDFAYGAMAMGADARKAVEVACLYDAYCGGEVEVVNFAKRR